MLSDFRLGIKFANIIAIGTLYLHDLFPFAPFDYHPHRNKTKWRIQRLRPECGVSGEKPLKSHTLVRRFHPLPPGTLRFLGALQSCDF